MFRQRGMSAFFDFRKKEPMWHNVKKTQDKTRGGR